ncbi:MAG: DNA topoisomerase (ATP-hydrolyzing) subunit B [Planctomycetota bacterium]|nr:MAG: DNA topoisomerase (ATP-hydrolyzing) subunit B [Planctomycetota bacterium]
MSDKQEPTYDSQSIQYLKDLEGVRKRPAMYIGDTDFAGFHHLLWEIVDNSVDEALAGYCDQVHVILNEDGSATVTDNGRGIPVGIHPEEGMPAVELVMTKLHAGGKFDGKAYAVSGGLHGVGISVVNALSEWTEVEVFQNGQVHHIAFSRGNTTSPLRVTGKTERRGTRVSFRPDREIFQHDGFDWDVVRNRLREMAYLMGSTGLRIVLEDARSGKQETFHYPEGLVAYIQDLTEGKEAITEVVRFEREVEHAGKSYGVEIALRYTNDWHEGVFSFANNIRTADGGTHLSGFRAGLTRTLNAWLKQSDLLKKGEAPTGDDYKAGLYAVVSIKIPDPQFEGQTKGKLGSREAASIVESVTNECLGEYLDSHPEAARAILRKALLARDAREAARKQRDLVRRKGALSSGSLPGKLADCQSRNRDETELFIVEGDSAGGSAKTGRDRRFQAILPLKGKILNVEKNTANRVLANQELQTMIQAIGAGVGEDFDPDKARYGKIIIMTDADVDGSHIRTLILTFLFRQMRELIEAGRVYVAQPPLYLLKKKSAKHGRYIQDEESLRRALLAAAIDGAEVAVPTPDGERTLAGAELERAVAALERLEGCLAAFRGGRRGVDARDWIAAAGERGLPVCLVVPAGGGEGRWFWSEAERDEYLAGLGGARVWDGPDSAVPREEADHLVFTFHEREEVQAALTAAAAAGLPAGAEAWNGGLVARHGKEERRVAGPLELLAALRELGQKNIEVQRYKGLGEMNPEQLWESTMDPARRSLKRIVLEDAFEADRIFSMLMGDETEPRRRYIEEHALEVSNLDI